MKTTTITLTAGMKMIRNKDLPTRVGLDHVYFMSIAQTDTETASHTVQNFTFAGGELGWLQLQVTADNFKDSLNPVTVIDHTVDPR